MINLWFNFYPLVFFKRSNVIFQDDSAKRHEKKFIEVKFKRRDEDKVEAIIETLHIVGISQHIIIGAGYRLDPFALFRLHVALQNGEMDSALFEALIITDTNMISVLDIIKDKRVQDAVVSGV